jgi:putative peptidoglycan lipid II flippase
MRLCDFPQGIFVLALQAATLPSLARLVAQGHRDEAMKTWAYGMRLAMFVAVPATALLVGLARPIVAAIFQGGRFDAESVTQTGHALAAQGLGIWTVALVRQILPVYYALGDTRTPVIVSLLDLAAFIVLAVTLRGPLGHVGIGLAVAGSSAVQMALLWAGLVAKKLPSLHARELAASIARTTVASAAAAACGAALAGALSPRPDAPAITRLIPATAGGLAFGATFLLVAWLTRSPELREMADAVARRLRRARV